MTSYYKVSFKLRLLFLGLVGFSCFSAAFASSTWESVVVERILSNNVYLLSDGRKVELGKIELPEITDKSSPCARNFRRFLSSELKNRLVKIMLIRENKSGVFIVYLKVDNNFLAEKLLTMGAGQLENRDLSYHKNKFISAEKLGKSLEIGIWGGCETKDLSSYNERFAKLDFLKERYGTYLDNISVGTVKEVVAGNRFVLENGHEVQLIGVETPLLDDPRLAFACFADFSKKKLSSLILGKRVFLRRDNSQLSENRSLLRYVFIPKTRNQQEIFVNEVMISAGFGKNYWTSFDNWHQERLEGRQFSGYKKEDGAWLACLKDVFPRKKEAVLKVSDKDCLIKGNVSGTKKKPRKKFHTVNSPWYQRVKAEVCFTSEAAAFAAGFEKVR